MLFDNIGVPGRGASISADKTQPKSTRAPRADVSVCGHDDFCDQAAEFQRPGAARSGTAITIDRKTEHFRRLNPGASGTAADGAAQAVGRAASVLGPHGGERVR